MDKVIENNNSIQKIGIMGGTFNPIHNGHLLIADYAREEYNLSQVLFLPTGHSPHKLKQQITPASQRCDMITLAIQDNPFFALELMEVEEERISYTYLTLPKLKEKYGNAELYFILGADSLFDIEYWKEPGKILASCNVLAAYREDKRELDFMKQISYLNKKYHAHIYPLHMPCFDVSSSNIRSRINHNLSIRYLVPKEVADYIHTNKLYQES